MRLFLRLCLIAALAGAGLFAWGLSNARADPVVRTARVSLPGWPEGAPPMRVALLSDIHVGSRAMDAARLARIVDRVNALSPDLIVLSGDFIAGHGEGLAAKRAPALAPLAQLRARAGIVAVLGNHDHWTGAPAVRDALIRANIRVLDNRAARVGPLTIAGIDDIYTGHARIRAARDAAAALGGPVIAISHGPDVVPKLPRTMALTLVGHTHCGQIVLPWWGPIVLPTDYGDRYACGIVREPGRATIITAGLGTSVLPLRWGAPPDLWLVTIGR